MDTTTKETAQPTAGPWRDLYQAALEMKAVIDLMEFNDELSPEAIADNSRWSAAIAKAEGRLS